MLTTEATRFTGESLPRCLASHLLDPQLVEVEAAEQISALAAGSLNFNMQKRPRPTGAGPPCPPRLATITAPETGRSAAWPAPSSTATAAISRARATSTAIWIPLCKPPAVTTA